MNLDAIQVELRPRRGWEAVDLGCSLVRRFAGSVWKAWFLLVLPAQVLLAILLWNHPLLALFILWWFKPFASSVVLQVLSRELFGQRPQLKQLLRTLPLHWLKLAPTLLLGQRLNPLRCFVQPLYELEGNLKSKRRKQRMRALSSYSLASGNLTSICLLLEPILLFGLLNLGLMAVPESVQEGWFHALEDLMLSTFSFSAELHADWLGLRQLLLVLFILVLLLLEPFYVGGGFLLYLNARTILEGWDVEVAFKRLSQRLQSLGFTPSTPTTAATPPQVMPHTVPTPVPLAAPQPQLGIPPKPEALEQRPPSNQPSNPPNHTLALFLLSLLGLSLALATPNAHAQDPTPQEQAKEILADEDFEVQTTRVPVPEIDTPQSDLNLGWLGGLISVLSYLFLGLLLLAFLGLLLWLILHYMKRRKDATPRGIESHAITPATHLAGLDLRAESLPDDIPASARQLWASGQQREALALLYRGSLAWLQSNAGLAIHSSDTEHDCLRRSRRSAPLAPIQSYFESLTQSWIRAAYGEDFPQDSSFQDLCANWPLVPEMASQIQQALAAEEAARLARNKPSSSASKATNQLSNAATRLIPLMLLLPLLFSCGSKQQWEEVETGYRGEAKRNPFLAAQRLLELNGWISQSSRSLNELREQEPHLILAPAASVDDESAVRLLQEAVASGAHLCLLMEDGEAWINSYLKNLEYHEYQLEEQSLLAAWLEELEIQASEPASFEYGLRLQLSELGKSSYEVYQPSDTRFEPQQAGDWEITQTPEATGETPASREQEIDAQYPAILTRSYGLGRVTVLASAAPFRNRHLSEKDHAALLLDLAELPSIAEIEFAQLDSRAQSKLAFIILRTEASFWKLLWENGWPALIGSALALLLLLWARMPRRQPVAAELDSHQRFSVEDQLVGMGSFFWSHGQREDLLGALRRRVISQWRIQRPLSHAAQSMANALSGEEIKQLASLSNLPASQVHHALQEHHGELSATELEALIRSLQYLHASLSKL